MFSRQDGNFFLKRFGDESSADFLGHDGKTKKFIFNFRSLNYTWQKTEGFKKQNHVV